MAEGKIDLSLDVKGIGELKSKLKEIKEKDSTKKSTKPTKDTRMDM